MISIKTSFLITPLDHVSAKPAGMYMCVQWDHPEKSIEIDCFDKNYFSIYAWMALMPSFTATRFAVFNTLYIMLHDSNHWWSQCQNITGIHGYNAAHSLCSSGWFGAVFQPCAACGSAIVSKRLQSALHAGAEALIQTANAPVSHRSLWTGRGRSGFMDLTQPCGALQRTAGLLLRWNPGWLWHREHSSTRALKVRMGCFISHSSSWMSAQSFSTSAWLDA